MSSRRTSTAAPRARTARTVALALGAIASALSGCVGTLSEAGGDPGNGNPPGTPGDGGGMATAPDGTALEPLYPYSTVGSRCEGGAPVEYLVLSTEPADCAAHAAALDAADPSRFVRIALNGAANVIATATLCDGGECAPAEVRVDVVSDASGARGSWSATIAGQARRETFDAVRCDFDSRLAPGDQAPVGDLALSEVALYQGVKITVARDGASVSPSAPIVAGREGLLRVFVEPRAGYQPRELVARVELGDGVPIEVRGTLRAASRDEDLDSTFNVSIPADRISPDVPISVGVYEVEASCDGAPGVAGARFPASGTVPLAARSNGGPLQVVLVPVRYLADGSGRLPDTTDENVQAFAEEMRALFPVRGVEISLRSTPLEWGDFVGSDGTGWSALLNECMNVRNRDNPPDDTFYYCLFTPASSAFDYCGRGCVAGLGFVPDVQGEPYRVSIGLGYRGQQGTFAHEVGHTLGRPHAPCGGVEGADPRFPYSGGAIGSWGYDIRTGELFSPSDHTDFMGYCGDTWISDYNYGLIFERIRQVRGTAALISGTPQRYATVVVDIDGSLRWGSDVVLAALPPGERVAATWTERGVSSHVEGVLVAVDHVPGGVIYVPAQDGAERLDLDGLGSLATR